MPNENKDAKEKLLQLMHEVIRQDTELREKFKIGEKFRFIRDRLKIVFNRVEENLTALKQEMEKQEKIVSEDETLVFVYLYNTQGMVLKTWQKLLNPAVFYEYSVNRPIYPEKSSIETYIKNKANKSQHAFLTIVVKKKDILASSDTMKDSFNHPLVKVREGSLNFNKMISFTHAGNEYIVNENGEIAKKI